MPKATNAKRLALAIAKIKDSVETHIKTVASSNIQNAFCVIMPTRPDVQAPTQEMLEQIKSDVLERFKHENLFGLAIQYFIPPGFSANKQEDAPAYEMRVGIASFDEGWQIDEFAKGLLYCPSEREMGKWHARYARQEESLRLTPLLDSVLKDMQSRQYVQQFLVQPSREFFDFTAREHAKTDVHIPHAERTSDIRVLYEELEDFPSSEFPIFFAYSRAQELSNKSQNLKIKSLLKGFLRAVEARCEEIARSFGAPQATIEEILCSLRGESIDRPKQAYKAERPAQGLYYFRVAQILMLFILEFLDEDRFASGEIAMFIWLCQHIAFDFPHLGIKITDLLNLTCDQFHPWKRCIRLKEHEILLTEGLNEIFIAWLGKKQRINGRKLFTTLSFDFLADNFKRISAALPQFERDLQPSDLLITPHVLGNDIPLDRNGRRHLNWQIDFVVKSPYADTEHLTKQIRETISAFLSKSDR